MSNSENCIGDDRFRRWLTIERKRVEDVRLSRKHCVHNNKC